MKMFANLRGWFEGSARPRGLLMRTAWWLGLILLPATSLPFFARLAGVNAVAAPSTLFFVLLFAAWWLPYILRGGRVPGHTLPFIAFILAALVTAAQAHFLPIPPFKDGLLFRETLRILITLGLAAAIYLVSATWVRKPSQLAWIQKWVNWSGLCLILWSFGQGYYVLFVGSQYPEWMLTVQETISTRGLFYNRVTGFAFEPSWLAHQLNVLYLPFWLAATVMGHSAHRRIWKISLENILLGLGAVVLFFSFSRVGWLSFFLVLAVYGLWRVWIFAGRLQKTILQKVNVRPALKRIARPMVSSLIGLGFSAVLLGSGILLVWVGGRLDYRLNNVFDRIIQAEHFYDFVNRLYIAERVVYWDVGWQVFNDYPLLGVGLGHAGFFFNEKISWFGVRLVEIRTVMMRLDTVPNTKSLWTRLLAETGVVGFGLFLTWLYVLWRSGQLSQHSQFPAVRTTALGGQFAIIAFLVEGFSVDTFGLPYLWLAVGLLTASASMYLNESRMVAHKVNDPNETKV